MGKNKVNFDASKYVNVETGEFLSDEIRSSKEDSSDLVIMGSSEYVIIDSKAREFIQSRFSVVESGRIFQMCDMVKSYYNLLYDKKSRNYHTKDSLMKEFDYTRNIFAKFMKKLYDESVICYI